MKFGLFYEHQLPRPYDQDDWDVEDEHKILKNALDQVELADQLSFDYVFEVEHHFLEEYSHSSAPEIFLAAASQRTKNIRLGHGIVVMPRATTTPPASPSASPRSTSSPTAASSSAQVSPPPRWRWAASACAAKRRRACGKRPPASA